MVSAVLESLTPGFDAWHQPDVREEADVRFAISLTAAALLGRDLVPLCGAEDLLLLVERSLNIDTIRVLGSRQLLQVVEPVLPAEDDRLRVERVPVLADAGGGFLRGVDPDAAQH